MTPERLQEYFEKSLAQMRREHVGRMRDLREHGEQRKKTIIAFELGLASIAVAFAIDALLKDAWGAAIVWAVATLLPLTISFYYVRDIRAERRKQLMLELMEGDWPPVQSRKRRTK